MYESLKAANIHITGSSRGFFKIRKIGVVLVDLDKSQIIERRESPLRIKTGRSERNALVGENLEVPKLTSPPEALQPVELTEVEIGQIEEATKGMH